MTKLTLGKSEIAFLLILAEKQRYLTYEDIVETFFNSFNHNAQVASEATEVDRKKANARFRQAKRKIKKIQSDKSLGLVYFHEEAGRFKIADESVAEKPRTCIILLELICAAGNFEKEVKYEQFEIDVSEKYKELGADFSPAFVSEKMKDACKNKYAALNKRDKRYECLARLSIELKLISRIVENYQNAGEPGAETKAKLKELLDKVRNIK
jgi:hypothetical protein